MFMVQWSRVWIRESRVLLRRSSAFGRAAALAALVFGAASCSDGASANDERLAVSADALGSSEQPQDIDTLAELRAMTLTGNYRLTADITMQPWNAAFVPIGGNGQPFRGTFDGGTFKIHNLRVVGGQNLDAGLFGAVENAILRRVALVNVNVSGSGSLGAIAGRAYNSEITDSYVEGGTVNGTSSSGGRSVGMGVGLALHATRIRRCYAKGNVTGRAEFVGGFIGKIFTYGVPTLYFDPRVWVEEVFTEVAVNPTMPAQLGNIYAGGLVGHVHGSYIQNVNVVGSVLGRGYAGGVIGYIVNNEPTSSQSVLRHTISRGIVTVSDVPNRAGVIGFNVGQFGNCGSNFWNNQTDGGSPPPMDDSFCQTGKPTAELTAPHPDPNKLIAPYQNGMLITQAMIDDPEQPWVQCQLASGSDGDWGFGTCGLTQIWALNAADQYITLTRIPNPSIQPR